MRALRALAQGCLGAGGRLRTSRGGGLYVTGDLAAAPRLEQAGFATWQGKGLLHIGLDQRLLTWLQASLPPPPPGDFLLDQLSQLGGRAVLPQELALVEEALKAGEPGGAARPDFEKRLRQLAAVCLRQGAGGGALALAWRIRISATKEASS